MECWIYLLWVRIKIISGDIAFMQRGFYVGCFVCPKVASHLTMASTDNIIDMHLVSFKDYAAGTRWPMFLLTLALSYSSKSCLHCRSHISKPTAVRTTISKHLTLPKKSERNSILSWFGETYWYFMASNDLVWFGMLCANVAWWYAVQALHLNSVVHVNINVAWVLQVGIVLVKRCSATAT